MCMFVCVCAYVCFVCVFMTKIDSYATGNEAMELHEKLRNIYICAVFLGVKHSYENPAHVMLAMMYCH